jgi:hypothetical protein
MESKMMNMKRLWVAVLAAVPLTAIAHHGWTEYDATRPLTLTGTIMAS